MADPEFESSENVASALTAWLCTFDGVDIAGLEDLADGTVLLGVLSTIAPAFFTGAPEETGEETVTQLLQDLAFYFNSGLEFEPDLVARLAPGRIANDKHPGQLQRLAQLVLGAAAFCDERGRFLGPITSMPTEHKVALMASVKAFQTEVEGSDDEDELGDGGSDDDDDGGDGAASVDSDGSERPRRTASFQSDTSLQSPRGRAGIDVDARMLSLEVENQNLVEKTTELQETVDRLLREAAGAADGAGTVAMERDRAVLARERDAAQLQQVRKELEAKTAEASELKKKSAARVGALEEEVKQLKQQVQIVQAEKAQLATSASSLRRARERLDELNETSKTLKAKNKEYMAQVVTLEGDLRAATSRADKLKKQLADQEAGAKAAGDRTGEFGAELARLRGRLQQSEEARRFAEEQLASSGPGRRVAADSDSDKDSDDGAGGGVAFGTGADDSERVMRLELEKEQLRGEAEVLQKQVQELTQQVEARGAEGAAAQQALQAELEAAKAAAATAEAAMQNLMSENEDMKKKLVKLFKLNKEREARAAEAAKANKEREARAAEAAKVAVTSQEVEKLKAELRSARVKEKQLTSRFREFVKRVKTKQEEKKREVGELEQKLERESKRLDIKSRQLAAAQRKIEAQDKEDGIMASAFFELGLAHLTEEERDVPLAWLPRAREESSGFGTSARRAGGRG